VACFIHGALSSEEPSAAPHCAVRDASWIRAHWCCRALIPPRLGLDLVLRLGKRVVLFRIVTHHDIGGPLE
jgi:hypothetical protein